MKTSESINEIATALAQAQAEIQNPAKTADNPFFKSKYADLAEVLSVVRPAFSSNGLSVVQFPYSTDEQVGVTTMISHSSGQWMQGDIALPLQVAKNIAQDAGKIVTYLRRYSLAAAAGVAQEDPDANLSSDKDSNTGKVTTIKAITQAQAAQINRLIEETGSNSVAFLNFAGADSVDAIPRSKYEEVHDALLSKKEKTA